LKTCLAVLVSGITLAGCTSTSYQRPNGPVGLSYGSIESFSALVPSSDGAPRCVDPTEAPVERGGRAVAQVREGSRDQQVTVTLDQDGTPTKYLDVRGDLSVADDHVGDRTTIALFLTEGYAVLSNRPAHGEPIILQVPLAEASSSDRLGNPDDRLRDVLAACGATT